MAATNSLLANLRRDFPDLTFTEGSTFRWAPDERSIYVAALKTPRDKATLLHELGHAMCGHSDFEHDIDLVKMEREAWTKAQAVAPGYDVVIDEDIVENALDTYRDWLDARSRCPNCGQTGVQEQEATYNCIICHVGWRVNDARQCGLKRYRLSLD
jgi:hypothetical protein